MPYSHDFLRVRGTRTDIAKTSPHVLIPERFALHLGTHIVSKYAHLHKAFITVEQLRWQRIPISQGAGQTPKEHSHAFYRDGDEKRTVDVEVRVVIGRRYHAGEVLTAHRLPLSLFARIHLHAYLDRSTRLRARTNSSLA